MTFTAAVRRTGQATTSAIRHVLCDEQTGQVDVAQIGLFVGIGLATYGIGLMFPPAAFLFAGGALIWLFLPTRPPFLRDGKS